jgi:hypothetical protein
VAQGKQIMSKKQMHYILLFRFRRGKIPSVEAAQ